MALIHETIHRFIFDNDDEANEVIRHLGEAKIPIQAQGRILVDSESAKEHGFKAGSFLHVEIKHDHYVDAVMKIVKVL